MAGPFTGHTDAVRSIAFSPDGNRIASASSDRTIRVWDATTGEVVAGPFTEHASWVRSIAFSPDGQRIASASDDCTVRVWDAATGQITAAGPFTGHINWVLSVAFSPDGKRIASASEDRTVRVWDAVTGQIVAGPFMGHTDAVRSVAFSPGGRHIASASSDRTIRVWDATVLPVTEHTPLVSSVSVESPPAGGQSQGNMEKIHFGDQSLINSDGWIYEDLEEKELLLWIPELYRPCLHRSSTVWIAGEHETRLDLSMFVHGSDWARVYDHNM
jgi:WD40 repeat protein